MKAYLYQQLRGALRRIAHTGGVVVSPDFFARRLPSGGIQIDFCGHPEYVVPAGAHTDPEEILLAASYGAACWEDPYPAIVGTVEQGRYVRPVPPVVS